MKESVNHRLSLWASRHRAAAIGCIVVAKIAIGIIGFNLGLWSAIEGLALSADLKWLLAAVSACIIFAYPARRLRQRIGGATFYRRQKIADGMLATLGFVIFFWLGNLAPGAVMQPSVQQAPIRVLWSSLQREDAASLPEIAPEKQNSVKKTGRAGKLKQWFAAKIKKRIERKMERFARFAKDTGTPEKVLLTLLLLLLAFLALYLVAVLSCNLSCNGQEGLAVLVAVVGVAGIVIGLIYGFGSLWRKNDDADIERRQREGRKPTEIHN
jgi:hypothetical protein